jgi:hypothetical protein
MFRHCDLWLELGKVMRIRVSSIHIGFLGLEITHLGGGHLGVVACPMKSLEGQVAHRAAALMHQHLQTYIIEIGACHKQFKKY